jgi:hypothetical protein
MVTSSVVRWFQQTMFVAALFVLAAGTALAADDPGPAKMETVKSITQYGITWTFDKEVQVGRFVTGDYFVIGPVTIAKIDPAPVGEGEAFRNGSMLNPPTNTDQAYDGRIRGFKPNLVAKAPLTLNPNDSLLSSISVEERNKLQNVILANPSKTTEESPIRTIAVLTCLAAPPPADAFRPSYCDLKKSKLYLARNVLWEVLPKVKAVEAKSGDQLWAQRYAKDAFDAHGVPTFAWLERAFERPWVDHIYGWDSRNMHPLENMPGYGRELGRMVSYAALALCTDATKEQKEKLCLRFIQVGIDNWGVATRSKRGSEGGWPAAGGFGNGRKLPIVFAGYMLNDLEGMRMIRKFAPECSFGEDEHVEFGPSWTGARVRFTGQYPLIGAKQIDRGPYEHLPPAQWPAQKGGNPTMSEGYRRCCTSISWVGQALAVRLMHIEPVWDYDAFFVYVDRWMYEDDTKFAEEIAKAHPKFGAGIKQGGTHFDPWIDAMWAAYRKTIGIPTDGWKAGAAVKGDPLLIRRAAGAVTIDGDLAEWEAVPAILPGKTREPASTFRFCWDDKGLYGAALVRDANLAVDAEWPAKGDALEVWIEKDFARSGDRSPNSTQFLITAGTSSTSGQGRAISQTGGVRGGNDTQFSDADRKALWKDAGVTSAWKKVDGGYTLEFLIPADKLAPAKMEDGTKIGFNFALDDGGQTAEWFYNYGITGCWHRPTKWGAAVLVK